ncbi:MAG: tryptophan-rich sensory protein [Gammaproteobacteria bacterium]
MKWLSLIVWIALCLSAGFIGALFSPGEWYQSLEKSSLTPLDIAFPIVWNILFILMGVAAWRVWLRRSQDTFFALLLFIIQLGLNMLWSYLFFGLQRPGLALIEIIVLWAKKY